LDQELTRADSVTEPRVFFELSRILPGEATVFVGNSMPIRDLDCFFPARKDSIRFLANRGASGIDGVISSGLGASTVGSGPLVLVLGDLSFYHDMNGLLAASRFNLDACIILINNDGGGIFSFLPQAELENHFEDLFGTPHGLDFCHSADLYGIDYELVDSWEGFRTALTRETTSSGVGIIEVRSDRRANLEEHRRLWAAVSESVSELRREVYPDGEET
jgi:2-succinyl-5-enolpyruvyl-6-hydroxy-3-cyclohexene-1-carboxylate synthase